jgi:hypothetical protein
MIIQNLCKNAALVISIKIGPIVNSFLNCLSFAPEKILIAGLLVIIFIIPAKFQFYSDDGAMPISTIVDTFYKRLENNLFWFDADPQSSILKSKLVSLLKERCAFQGLDDRKYLSFLPGNMPQDFSGVRSVNIRH